MSEAFPLPFTINFVKTHSLCYRLKAAPWIGRDTFILHSLFFTLHLPSPSRLSGYGLAGTIEGVFHKRLPLTICQIVYLLHENPVFPPDREVG